MGLFTINAFRYNWKVIIIPAIIAGSAFSLIHQSAWHYIPTFIGSYLAGLHAEYVNYKQSNNGAE